MRLIVGHGMRLVGLGILTGLGAGLAFTRAIRVLLFGVSPADPLTFAGIALLLGMVGLLACYIPARRAAKTDLTITLRYE
jgi:putative ABC transport system permease protein